MSTVCLFDMYGWERYIPTYRDRPSAPPESRRYVCYSCDRPMSPERDDCYKCPQCGKDHWRISETTEWTGVRFGGVDELDTHEVARCLCCGYTCDPEDREMTDDSRCEYCYHVGAPVDVRADARESE